MKVAVVGCGYVGLITALGLARVGHRVTGVEIVEGRRRDIASGVAPFHEPGVAEALRASLDDGSFTVAGEVAAARDAEVVLLAVQTPPDADGGIDLGALEGAAHELGVALADRRDDPPAVAVRSTVVPGTVAERVAPVLGQAMGADEVVVASNPEFLQEGSALADFMRADRVVIGSDVAWVGDRLEKMYTPLGAPVLRVPSRAAELAKYASNALLATLISYSNEIGRIAEDLPGVDSEEVLGVLHADRRLRPFVDGVHVTPGILSYLRAGCGYGGSCLPKDLSALIAVRAADGQETPLLSAVRSINEAQPRRLVELTAEALEGLHGRRVAVLGLAFKGGTDDLRSSPGLEVLDLFTAAEADVVAFDPLVSPDAAARHGVRSRVAATLEEALEGAEACVVTTNAPEFATLPVAVPLVVDGRRAVDPASARRYVGIGRGPELCVDSAAARSSGVPISR